MALCAVSVLCAGPAIAQLPDFSGRPIVDLIESLRDQGTRIVYSAEVLPARLRVTVMPATADPLEGLREILAAYGLGIDIGPRDTWLVVRRAVSVEPPPESGVRPPATLVPPSLETVVVTASRYPIERSTATYSQLGRRTLETTPALGHDPLRITQKLPGITADQISSRVHIRGGNLDEVLLTLDGVRLYNPYHLKDFQNLFSSINSRIVESMDVRTGGYDARFGDRLSGVIEIESIRPTEHRHHELATGLLSSSVLSSGLFDNGRGSWVTSLRRGHLDVIADIADSDIGTPQYVDFFNKLDYELRPGIRITAGMLSLDDKITLNDGTTASAAADYDDTYLWVALEQNSPSGLDASYRVSTANLKKTRMGVIDDPQRVTGSLDEDASFDRTALSADWAIQPLDSLRISWGAEVAGLDLDHRVESSRTNLQPMTASDLTSASNPPTRAVVRLDQTKRAVYASFRYQPMPRFVTEIGLRRDDQTLTDEHQVSPRLGLLFDVTDSTSLRASWGSFAQSDSLSELDVADGLTSLQKARQSRHFILGVEHDFGGMALLRAEVYEKRARRLNLRFENLFEKVSLLPELLPDRFAVDPTHAETRGFEVSVEGGNDTLNWWANVAISRTREHLPTGTFRRSWDERRSLKAGGEWLRGPWTVAASLGHRSGWPISGLRLENGELVAVAFNSARLSSFSSIDVRASRVQSVELGELEWFVEISNLLDHDNYCCVDYSVLAGVGGSPDTLAAEYDNLLGIVPDFGIRWTF